MPQYPDRRKRYEGVAPWEAASIKEQSLATRESSPSSHFRLTTAEIPPKLEPAPVVSEPAAPVPVEKDTEL